METMDRKLAVMILTAMKAREDSYDQTAADEATANALQECEDEPNKFYAGIVDYKQFYRKTLRQACDEVAAANGEPHMGEPIYYLLKYTWNDISLWAEEHRDELCLFKQLVKRTVKYSDLRHMELALQLYKDNRQIFVTVLRASFVEKLDAAIATGVLNKELDVNNAGLMPLATELYEFFGFVKS